MNNQNLIINGDFETDRVDTTASNWNGDYLIEHTPSGWSTTPAGVDLINDEHGKFGTQKTPYGQYVELDGRRNTSIEQTISTIAGETYKLSFDWALPSYEWANYSFPDPSSQFQVKVDDEIAFEYDGSYGIRNGWTSQALTFRAKSNKTKISFTEVGQSDKEGTLLDNISVTANQIIRGNSLYTTVDGPSWTEAEARSVKLGGNLTAINSLDENEFIYKLIADDELQDIPDLNPLGYHEFDDIIVDDYLSRIPEQVGSSYWIGLSQEPTKSGEYFNFEWNKPTWSSGDEYSDLGIDLSVNFVAATIQNHGPRWPIESFFGIVGSDGEDAKTWIETNKVGGEYGIHLYKTTKGIAEVPFIRRGDSAYVIVEGPTWEEAEANANALGGHLVTINDAEENEWILNNIEWREPKDPNYGAYKAGDAIAYWIGLNDKKSEGTTEWSSGQKSTYRRSSSSDSNGTEDWYTIVNPSGGWNDLTQTPGDWSMGNWQMEYGIAEIPLAPNNTPTGTPTLAGDFKVGQTITMDPSVMEEADNFEG